MEALILIFAEIIIACMMPILALVGAAAGLVLEALLWGLAALFGGVFEVWREARRAKRSTSRPGAPPRKPLIPRKLVHWVAGSLAVLGVVGVIASFVFLQPVLRYVLDKAATQAGMEVEFASASGTLLTGNVTLEGVTLLRDDEDGLSFDLVVETAQADVNIWSLLRKTPVIELARVEGMTGYVSPPRPLTDEDAAERESGPKPRRSFRANLVEAREVTLDIRPKDSEAFALNIDEAQVAPFRSTLALFDLLFRSNMKAEVAGQALLVETRPITGAGRETRWLFEDVEAEKLRLLVPRAPLTWLSGGEVTASVEDRWSLEEDWVDMAWLIAFRDIRVDVPEEAGRTEKLLGGAFGKLVNSRGGNAEFRYELQLDKAQMDALRAGDLSMFWDTVLKGLLITGGGKDDPEPEEEEIVAPPDAAVEDDKPGAFDKFKGLFKRDKAE